MAEMSREEAIKELDIAKVFLRESRGLHPCTIDAFKKAIEALSQPEIVRCEECKHFCKISFAEDFCDIDDRKCYDKHFCGWAERRTDE